MSKNEDNIDYDNIVENALRSVVKESLILASKNGLKNDHHFYISFNSEYPGVVIPPELVNENDSEIKIILQHQFWDLIVSEEIFSVTLSFSGVKQNLIIPFAAVTHFTDPSVGFGLQFTANDDKNSSELSEVITSIEDKNKKTAEEIKTNSSADVVSLDSFRKQPSNPN